MKKIVPFKKDLIFKTNVAEITSISLEHNLSLKENNLVSGNFVLTGSYKISDTSLNTENFEFKLPFDINIDEKYLTDNLIVDIDDFYYEILDNKKLSVNIDVLLDKLEEKPLIEPVKEFEEARCVEEEFPFKELEESISLEIPKNEINDIDNQPENEKIVVSSIFDNFGDNENFSSYYIYFFRENDTIESVMQKYSITKENLGLYNNLDELKIGDKLIIPSISNEKL